MVGVDLLDYSSDQLHDEEIWIVTSGSGFFEVEDPPPPWVEGFEPVTHPPNNRAKFFSPSDLLVTSPMISVVFGVLGSTGIVDGDLFSLSWREYEAFSSLASRVRVK